MCCLYRGGFISGKPLGTHLNSNFYHSLEICRQLFAGRIALLCIEDDPDITYLLCDELFCSPLFVSTKADTFEKAEAAVLSKHLHHCWILDLTLNRHNDGLDLLRKKPLFPYCVVASGSISLYDATIAMREGAFGAYDKNAIMVSNTHDFIKEVCALATLSLLLDARKPERFDMFTLLLNRFIRTQEEWSREYCLNERSVRNICEENSGLTARQFLYLYHTLNRILLDDCFVGYRSYTSENVPFSKETEDFFYSCAEYVVTHFDKVYGRWYR